VRPVRSWSFVVLSLALALAAPAVRAAIAPEAAAVVQRYVESTGGFAAWEGERSSHSRLKITAFGFEGTQDSWYMRPNLEADVTALGPFTLKDGFDGSVAWRVDQNGKLITLDGKDLEEKKASIWFENESWIAKDQGGGSVTFKGVKHDSTGNYNLIEIAPPIGNARQYWFSQETGLIDREDEKRDNNQIVTRLSDWVKVAGRLRARHFETEFVGMSANRAVGTLDSLWVNEPIDPARFAVPSGQASDVRWLKPGAPAVIPMRYSARHVWLKASLNGGPPEDFILDSGASVTLLDSAYAAKYGLKGEGNMQANGAGAAGAVQMTQIKSIAVPGGDGGIELDNQKIAILALNRYTAPYFWREAAGILGYDFISRFVIEIDYEQQTLTLHDPKTFTYSGKGTAVPLKLVNRVPTLTAMLDGEYEADYRVDVGSGSTLDLHGPFVTKHGLRDKIKKTVPITSGGFGGTFQDDVCRMKKFAIGPYSWTDPLVAFSGAPA
jgi:hypothetical protein